MRKPTLVAENEAQTLCKKCTAALFGGLGEGSNAEQVLAGGDLGGGVTLEGSEGVGVRHSDSVVRDADEGAPGVDQLNLDAGGPGVEGVLDEFLDHGTRAFDHFAGRNLVYGVRIEEANQPRGK